MSYPEVIAPHSSAGWFDNSTDEVWSGSTDCRVLAAWMTI